ncbi:MAG: hypothetical protein CVV27_12640 [Candidatus Melainabacteria bacterium HGW-Melainabacteria-1]|nr:MAG: hypothetical protein CVV27_12640 [Candidatus Melainabacteria bacterium HGW-Melainabacteria-1]
MEDIPFKPEDVRNGIKSVMNVDYETDFLPHIDGRYGFGLFPPSAEGATPQMVLYLGLKNGHEAAFDQVMQSRFRFDMEALEKLEGGEKGSDVEQNMQKLRNMVETHGVDWGGVYPANLAALHKEASAEGKEYWQDLRNPVTDASGIGQAMRDYDAKATRPGVDLAGTVFYQGLGEAQKTEDGVFYTAYAVYGYDSSGVLYRYDSETESTQKVFEDLPKIEKPAAVEPSQAGSAKLIETWQGVPVYSLGLELPKDELPEDIQPVFARKGDVWMLALTPDALKAALKGSQSAQLKQWVVQSGGKDPNALFFLDIKGAADLVKRFVPEIIDSDEDIKGFMQALEPWNSLFGASRQSKQGTEGKLDFNVDLDKVDLDAMGKFFAEATKEEAPVAEESSALSSLKANMYTVQTMVETFGVDHGGYYPKNVAELQTAASQPEADYWKALNNPFQDSENSDSSVVLINKADYIAGPEMAGKVLYEPIIDENGKVTVYRIFGIDSEGIIFSEDGEVLTLTNE